MRSLHIVATLALAFAAAAGTPAFAGGSDVSLSFPIGFSSGGEHKGLEPVPATATTTTTGGATAPEKLPRGWDQGKAEWKVPLQNGALASPVGHGRR